MSQIIFRTHSYLFYVNEEGVHKLQFMPTGKTRTITRSKGDYGVRHTHIDETNIYHWSSDVPETVARMIDAYFTKQGK